jgi:hypothetical protein
LFALDKEKRKKFQDILGHNNEKAGVLLLVGFKG